MKIRKKVLFLFLAALLLNGYVLTSVNIPVSAQGAGCGGCCSRRYNCCTSSCQWWNVFCYGNCASLSSDCNDVCGSGGSCSEPEDCPDV